MFRGITNLLPYLMGLNAVYRKYSLVRKRQLTTEEIDALQALMSKYPRWAGSFVPPFLDASGNVIVWRNRSAVRFAARWEKGPIL